MCQRKEKGIYIDIYIPLIPQTGMRQKRVEGKQKFKKRGGGGQGGSRGRCLKKAGGWGAGTPLQMMRRDLQVILRN